MKRYIVTRSPVKNTITGKVIGYRVRLSDGTSYFTQTVQVPRGHCVNFGPTWETR
jgi:hypothetical protein